MSVDELYNRCMELACAEPSAQAVRYMHETLVLACAEALRGSGQGFGNLFSQVDYLCKRHHVPVGERTAIQLMRRHSNRSEVPAKDDWLYDIRALSRFVAAIFHASIPHSLLVRIPAQPKAKESTRINLRHIRCVVDSWDDCHIMATTADGPVTFPVTDDTLPALLRPGMQLNLLDCHREGTAIEPGLVVVEPDYLVDISAIAACFQDYGHHPLSYLLQRMKPRANTQPILLGNLAGDVLDDTINQPDRTLGDTISDNFRMQALQFCTCPAFDGQRFKADARQQADHIREAVSQLFTTDYDRTKALLEPSFVCEQLGLQGRVDLMTTDMRLLVEQKAGKNWNIEHPQPGSKGLQREDHYVQLLLYYGVLRHNFRLSADRVDIRLLYSKYPARQGLLVVSYYQQLFREAISLRNRIVAQEMAIARDGFATVIPLLRADTLLQNAGKATFFDRYVRPDVEAVFSVFHRLSPTERDYAERMLTFVYREQLAQKVGVQEGQGGAQADLWTMPLTEKCSTGNILMALTLTDRRQSAVGSGYDLLLFSIPEQGDDFLPNFRRGDMVYVYRYDGEPDARVHILYKGVIQQLTDREVTVRLNDAQQNAAVFGDGTYAIEHGTSDIGATSAIRAIHAFCTARAERRQLLLGLRAPRRQPDRRLTRSYHPHYDAILEQAFQARDYFLLQGPPGTGKTSMALRFIVQEETGSVLLTAYTNRAVDEICAMLCDAGIDFLRLGSETACDPRFVSHLLDRRMGERPRLTLMQQQLQAVRVVVGTTSTLQSRPFLLQLKHFALCVVDEASQILEPNIIGLLSSDAVDRFILIGDHKQLPAVVQQPDDVPRLHDCRYSLFERLLRQEREAGRTDFTAILRRQGRMHPDIAAFPNMMFYGRERLECVPCPHQEETTLHYEAPSEDALDDLLKQRRVLFLPADTLDGDTFADKSNAAEARIVADLLRRIVRQYGAKFDADRTVGVIVPYRNQIAMIRREIALLNLPQLHAVSIDTVERYQGSQRDVIIYSFTVRNPYQLDFLTSNCIEEDGHVIDRKLNVAMTRARCQLLMTGNVAVLSRNPVFAELIRQYKE